MAITTTLQTKYSLQKVFVVILCLVMGLWGIYDHQVKIPAKARAYERGQVCLKTKNALESPPENTSTAGKVVEAKTAVDEQLKKLLDHQTSERLTPEEAARAVESIRARNEENWFQVLMLFQVALGEAKNRTATSEASPTFIGAYEVAKKGVDDTADVTPPGRFDMATQWMFILCLPFVPYFAWSLYRARKRVYTLEDDGTLHAPEGTWTKEQIADIDMSRWMSKSIAEVVATDGARVKMDDYVYRNTHLIVGAFASERYPDEWDDEARARKPETDAHGDEEATDEPVATEAEEEESVV